MILVLCLCSNSTRAQGQGLKKTDLPIVKDTCFEGWGHPLSDELYSLDSRIWCGKRTDGFYVIELFNRDDMPATIRIDFFTLGIKGEWQMCDL